MSSGVKIEVRSGEIGEVVVSGHALVDWRVDVSRVGDGKVEGDWADSIEQFGHVGREAGDVEESCFCSDGYGDGGAVAQVAGVVLCAAADGDVAESEACCWGWQSDGG